VDQTLYHFIAPAFVILNKFWSLAVFLSKQQKTLVRLAEAAARVRTYRNEPIAWATCPPASACAKADSKPGADAASAWSEAGQRKHATAAQVASGFIYFLELPRHSSNAPSVT